MLSQGLLLDSVAVLWPRLEQSLTTWFKQRRWHVILSGKFRRVMFHEMTVIQL